MPASLSLFQTCHPERSASRICPNKGAWREVEVEPGCGRLSPQAKSRAQSRELSKNPREYFFLKVRFNAFSKEFPETAFATEKSSRCFDSRSLALALAQHDKVIHF
jgi:hypothetical protein